MTHQDLMAGPPPTHLPADPAETELAGGDAPAAVVRRHPASPAAWAALAQQARDAEADDVTVYAYARVGYHRSLDMLRRNGWKGHGPVPWEHAPNRASCAPWACSPWRRARSARRRSGSAARRSCVTPRSRRTTSWLRRRPGHRCRGAWWLSARYTRHSATPRAHEPTQRRAAGPASPGEGGSDSRRTAWVGVREPGEVLGRIAPEPGDGAGVVGAEPASRRAPRPPIRSSETTRDIPNPTSSRSRSRRRSSAQMTSVGDTSGRPPSSAGRYVDRPSNSTRDGRREGRTTGLRRARGTANWVSMSTQPISASRMRTSDSPGDSSGVGKGQRTPTRTDVGPARHPDQLQLDSRCVPPAATRRRSPPPRRQTRVRGRHRVRSEPARSSGCHRARPRRPASSRPRWCLTPCRCASHRRPSR